MPSRSPFPAGFAAAAARFAAAWAAALAAFRQQALALFACGREGRVLSCLLKLLEEPLEPARAAPGGVRHVDAVFLRQPANFTSVSVICVWLPPAAGPSVPEAYFWQALPAA